MMDAADAEYLLSKLEENEDGGYDYSTFVKVAYGKQEAPADFYSRPVGGLTPRPDGTPRTRGTTMSAAPAAAPAPAPAPAAPAPAVRHANLQRASRHGHSCIRTKKHARHCPQAQPSG
jgi:hypothetical protein